MDANPNPIPNRMEALRAAAEAADREALAQQERALEVERAKVTAGMRRRQSLSEHNKKMEEAQQAEATQFASKVVRTLVQRAIQDAPRHRQLAERAEAIQVAAEERRLDAARQVTHHLVETATPHNL